MFIWLNLTNPNQLQDNVTKFEFRSIWINFTACVSQVSNKFSHQERSLSVHPGVSLFRWALFTKARKWIRASGHGWAGSIPTEEQQKVKLPPVKKYTTILSSCKFAPLTHVTVFIQNVSFFIQQFYLHIPSIFLKSCSLINKLKWNYCHCKTIVKLLLI